MKRNRLTFFAVLSLLGASAYLYTRSRGPFFPRMGAADIPPRKLENIIKRTDAALEKNPSDLAALVDRGVAHFHMGPEFYDESHDELSEAWRNGAFDKRVFYYLGVLYENLSIFEEADKQYRRFLNHEPEDREIRMRLARLEFRLGNWEEAIEQYHKLVQKDPKDVTSLINLGLAYQSRYKTESSKKGKDRKSDDELKGLLYQAVANLEGAAALNPELSKGIYLALADAYASSGAWDKAAPAAETELSKHPAENEKEVYSLLAQAYKKLNRKEDLQRVLDLKKKLKIK
ncbi:MAG: hypothetical protein A3A86_00225 [Elusimicrobia bacterium RIFCSPLOWO2_01_FULL_60_11]|nr:MAG: hypothetical protein A3A86_00225 [Elusimicrobia bacterium RIFCSPLOWO2_01_FULL_60_11]